MMSLTFGLFTQVSGSGPLGPLVFPICTLIRLFFFFFLLRPGCLNTCDFFSDMHIDQTEFCSDLAVFFPICTLIRLILAQTWLS